MQDEKLVEPLSQAPSSLLWRAAARAAQGEKSRVLSRYAVVGMPQPEKQLASPVLGGANAPCFNKGAHKGAQSARAEDFWRSGVLKRAANAESGNKSYSSFQMRCSPEKAKGQV